MSRIDRADVMRVAELARLRLADDEAAGMTTQLEKILGYVDLLDEVDVSGVEPTNQVLLVETPVRPDEPADELDPERAVANAPAFEGTAFVVPKVLDEEAEG